MRAESFFCAILFPFSVNSGSYTGELSEITQDLLERGLTPAYITIEYSLSDDCGLAGLRVVENSNPEALNSEVVEKVVSKVIGPFSWALHPNELVTLTTDIGSPLVDLSMRTKTISWNTEDGYRYVQCRFFTNGELASAWQTDGHGYQFIDKIKDRRVDRQLSKLGANTIKVSFVADGE